MNENKQEKLIRFTNTISGKYSNRSQSNKYPKEFAHINIYFIPLSSSIKETSLFYSEQSYEHNPWKPYRQSLLKLTIRKDKYILINYKISNHERIAGAGEYLRLLQEIKKDKLSLREGCAMHFREIRRGYYKGSLEPGERCLIKRNNKISYLKSKVEFNKNEWLSIDEGFDKMSNEKIWGSENGDFIFNKVENFDDRIHLNIII